MATTLAEPSSDSQLIDMYNRGMRTASKVVLNTDQLYAVCLLRLNNAVQPSDYAALKTAIEAVTGVQEIQLLIDHHTRATVPTDTQLIAVTEIHLRLESTVSP